MSHQIDTYTELRKQIHDDLRIQHPEWVQPNGESPMCDSYEARLTEILNTLTLRAWTESRAASHPELGAKLRIQKLIASSGPKTADKLGDARSLVHLVHVAHRARG